jgi:hypothetical protein
MAISERQSAPPAPPPSFAEVEAATIATNNKVAPKMAPGDVRPAVLGRQGNSTPPAPPAQFDPGRIPIGYQKAQQQRADLEAEHSRMRPNEPPTVLGNRAVQIVPPVQPKAFEPSGPVKGSVWPSYRYHRSKAPDGIIVTDAKDEAMKCKGEGWSTLPVAKEVGLGVPDRLEMLDRIVFALGMAAEDGEGPEEVLARVLAERDSFARQLAKKEKNSGSETK